MTTVLEINTIAVKKIDSIKPVTKEYKVARQCYA